jgi:site-specific recombinase XerD
MAVDGPLSNVGEANGTSLAISSPEEKWPVLARHEEAAEWLRIWVDLGRAPRTIDAYARGLVEYLEICDREGVDPVGANRAHVAVFVRELSSRPSHRGANVVSIDSGAGLANATIQQRLVPVRLFYDFLIEEGLRKSNPVGRGRYTPGRQFRGHERPLVPRMVKLPWIPTDQQWLEVLAVFRHEPIRNRVMLALAYDAALRREELCSLRSDDVDPAHRTLRVRAETTKTRRERIVPYSAATGVLLSDYLQHRATFSRARGPLFLSESRRNHTEPLTLWTWSKVVRRVALAAEVPRFSTHTTRHLCLTDLARMGWELHEIATFAGHRSTESTLRYIHLSGRDLAAKLNSSMAEVHAWRVKTLTEAGWVEPGRDRP